MDSSTGVDDGMSAETSDGNWRRSASGRHLNKSSSVGDSTSFSADSPEYRNAVMHPDSAGARSAWERSSMPTLPDTPLELLHRDSLQDQVPIQADQVTSAVSNYTFQALAYSPVRQNLSLEHEDILSDDKAADTFSSTQQLSENTYVVPGTSALQGRPEIVTSPNESSSLSPLSAAPPAPLPSGGQKQDLTDHASASGASNILHDQQRSPPQEYHEHSSTGPDLRSTFQWTWPPKGEPRKPKVVSEKVIEDETHKIMKEYFAEVDEPSVRDPPLYDSLLAKLRQKTVETWLLRSEVACIIEDWENMEKHARQAQKLAVDLQWEPFIAQCAFPIGKALYMQGDLLGAYQNVEEVAEKTQGYYVSKAETRYWLVKFANEVKTSLPQQRPSSLTPLTSVVEETEGFHLPRAELETLESEFPEDIYLPSNDVEASVDSPELSISSGHPKQRLSAASPEENRSVPSKASPAAMQGPTLIRPVPSQYIDNRISNASNNPSPALSARHGPPPTAIRLASNPMPASIGSPRLYDPAQSSGASPPLHGNSPQLRSGLLVQSHPASGLSEMLLPDAALAASPPSTVNDNPQSASEGDKSSASGGVPLPSWAIPQREKSDRGIRQPLNPSSLFAQREPLPSVEGQPLKVPSNEDRISREQDVESRTTSNLTKARPPSPSSISSLSAEHPTRHVSTLVESTQNASSIDVLQGTSLVQSHSGFTNGIDTKVSQPVPCSEEPQSKRPTNEPSASKSPNTAQVPNPPKPTNTINPDWKSRIDHLHHRIKHEDAEDDAKIQKAIAGASPLVRSARSAGYSAISPGWQRPWEKGRSAYAVRPKSSRGVGLQRAISERAAVPRVQNGVGQPSPPRRGPGLKWQDGWTKGGSVPTGRVLGEKQRNMMEGAKEESEIKDESTKAGREGDDGDGQVEDSIIAEEKEYEERDEVVEAEGGVFSFLYDSQSLCALM